KGERYESSAMGPNYRFRDSPGGRRYDDLRRFGKTARPKPRGCRDAREGWSRRQDPADRHRRTGDGTAVDCAVDLIAGRVAGERLLGRDDLPSHVEGRLLPAPVENAVGHLGGGVPAYPGHVQQLHGPDFLERSDRTSWRPHASWPSRVACARTLT